MPHIASDLTVTLMCFDVFLAGSENKDDAIRNELESLVFGSSPEALKPTWAQVGIYHVTCNRLLERRSREMIQPEAVL
jgi:hypothetical protein